MINVHNGLIADGKLSVVINSTKGDFVKDTADAVRIVDGWVVVETANSIAVVPAHAVQVMSIEFITEEPVEKVKAKP